MQPVLNQLGWQAFPDATAWDALPAHLRPATSRGRLVQFVVPPADDGAGYEVRIAEHGLVATRQDNWHDAFNALCWLAWPASKAALNALHLRELSLQTGKQRSRQRDLATLFDESGLVLACADPLLKAALMAHDWQTLFVARAADWGRLVEPFVLGHALLEKGLAPFVGIVAKVMVVEVAPDWFTQPVADKLRQLDRHIAEQLTHGEQPRREAMWPLPVLGIPGWWPLQDAAFYADQSHFRPRRPAVHPR
ncbi:DUF3025 domain-containing protein [Chitinimonas sp.]|uniref:DUF3025 domain-containing protein n=1 Tax=Chitinimonas sp. TaxID=1934313 RepID=UPI002F92C6D0